MSKNPWVIARDLNDEPRTIYWLGVDTCGNLVWRDLAMNPATWSTKAEAQRAWQSACEATAQRMSSQWRPPEARAVQLTAEQAARLWRRPCPPSA